MDRAGEGRKGGGEENLPLSNTFQFHTVTVAYVGL